MKIDLFHFSKKRKGKLKSDSLFSRKMPRDQECWKIWKKISFCSKSTNQPILDNIWEFCIFWKQRHANCKICIKSLSDEYKNSTFYSLIFSHHWWHQCQNISFFADSENIIQERNCVGRLEPQSLLPDSSPRHLRHLRNIFVH